MNGNSGIKGTIADIQTTNKDRILQLYLELNEISSIMLNQIKSCAPGNIFFTFVEFRQRMFELFSASHRYKNFDRTIKNRYYKWARVNTTQKPSNKFIFQSIDLYNDIIDELIRIEVLEL